MLIEIIRILQNIIVREGVKKTIESVILIIPRLTPSSFLRTVIALGYFFVLFLSNWVIRYVLKQIWVMFKTNFDYVLGEIYPQNA